jgi:P4 family phage/plasmid primase-like protien
MAEKNNDLMLELKEMHIWMLWEWAPGKDGHRTKKPFAANGRACSTDEKYSSRWVTYAEAVDAMKKFPGRAAGVGFKIPSGYFFLDIDEKGLEDPYVQTHLRRFVSYAETSVSGNGTHIYGKYDLSQIPTYIKKETDKKTGEIKERLCLDRQFYMKNPHNKTELYLGGLTNRFAVYTGDAVNDKPLKECTQAILTTLDKDMRRKQRKKYSAKRDGNEQAFRIIEALRGQKNGAKFSRLFDSGDISEYGGDDSAADCALCAMIAFRTGDDPALIEEIFNQSALVRDKWTSREDYREMTISAGIEACHGTFHRSAMPAPYFIKFDPAGSASVSAPLLARYVREHLHYIIVRDSTRGGTLIFVYEDGCYRPYSLDMFKGVIKGYVSGYDEELVSMRTVTETASQLLTDLDTRTSDDLNTDEDIINFKNGLLRLSDLALLPHSPDVLSTIQIPCEWHAAPCATPVFDSYMDTLSCGCHAVETLLLEFMGAVFSNVRGWRMKKALFLYGPGDTGKSQLKSLTERILGKQNFIGIDLAEIEARFGTAGIYGRRLAGSSDMSFLTVHELKTFKKCTGGDSLFAEFKGMDGFEFTYGGLLWFCMNRLPRFGGDDGQWVYDRILAVECSNVIPPGIQDKRLLEKMYAEREGVVHKAVTAFRRAVKNGYRFTEPKTVSDARDSYRGANSTVISFYNECMMERPEGRISDSCTTGRTYKVYKAWCQDNNNGYAKTAREFREELAVHLGTTFKEMSVHCEKGTFYRNLTLTPETRKHYVREYGYDDASEFLA